MRTITVSYTHLDVYKRQIPNHEVTTVAQALVHNFCCRYGTSTEILIDQGKHFESRVFKELCHLLSI